MAKATDMGLSNMNYQTIKNAVAAEHGYNAETGGTGSYRLEYQSTYDVLVVASLFVGIGEIKALINSKKVSDLSALTTKVAGIAEKEGYSAEDIAKIGTALKKSPQIAEEAAKYTDDIEKFRYLADEAGVVVKAGSYLENLPRYQQLFKEGKISELFSELKKTSAYPKMGETSKLSHESLLTKYTTNNSKYYPNYETHNNYPYSLNNPVTKYKLDETAYFVRFFADDALASKWVFRVEDLRQYSNIDEAIEKLAIPFDNGTLWGKKPNKIALVEIPKGTELIKSTAGAQIWKRELDGLPDLIQQGGGLQYEVLNYNSTWFKEIKGGSFNDIISNQ